MSLTVGELTAYLGVDDSQFNRTLNTAGSKWGKFGKTLAKGAALGAAGGALLGFAKVVKTGLGEVMDASAGQAQLEAGIKSTGNAANVTVEGLNELASSIQDYSGQTDDSIRQTEALLLTFTNIRNVGADRIFDDATKAAADMAAKMGGDASGAAVQLGKALNDPVKGVTALTRMGVQFTDAQKEQIKTLMASNDTLGAQKVILGELETQFGGAAKAAGESLPGKLDRLKRKFEDLSEAVVTKMTPAIEGAFDWLLTHQSEIAGAVSAIGDAFGVAWDIAKPLLKGLGYALKAVKELQGMSGKEDRNKAAIDNSLKVAAALKIDPATITSINEARSALEKVNVARQSIRDLKAAGIINDSEAKKLLGTVTTITSGINGKFVQLAADAGTQGKAATNKLKAPFQTLVLPSPAAPQVTGAYEAGVAAGQQIGLGMRMGIGSTISVSVQADYQGNDIVRRRRARGQTP